MFGNLKQLLAYVALFLVTSIVLFNGSFYSNTTDNNSFASPNPLDTFTITSNPGASNNGGSAGWAMFFDLIAGAHDVTITQMSTASTSAASGSFTVEVFTRNGTGLGGTVSSGPGSSSAGWTSLGSVPVTQGTTSNGISLVFSIPTFIVPAFDTIGVALKFAVVGPRYYGTGTPPYTVVSDSNLTLITGDGRSAPFTTTGSFFTSRALTGVIRYVVNPISVVGSLGGEIPKGYRLEQNYPNPFNPATSIEFAVPEKSNVVLKIYNSQGKEITTLVNEEYLTGTYNVRWDASGHSSGVYFYTIKTGKFTQTKKMLLVK
jgi:hypothetical protein